MKDYQDNSYERIGDDSRSPMLGDYIGTITLAACYTALLTAVIDGVF